MSSTRVPFKKAVSCVRIKANFMPILVFKANIHSKTQSFKRPHYKKMKEIHSKIDHIYTCASKSISKTTKIHSALTIINGFSFLFFFSKKNPYIPLSVHKLWSDIRTQLSTTSATFCLHFDCVMKHWIEIRQNIWHLYSWISIKYNTSLEIVFFAPFQLTQQPYMKKKCEKNVYIILITI